MQKGSVHKGLGRPINDSTMQCLFLRGRNGFCIRLEEPLVASHAAAGKW